MTTVQPKLDTSTDPQVGFRPAGTLAPAPLAPYAGHFAARHAAHLLRRAGFGGPAAEIAQLTALGPQGAVDSLLHPSGDDSSFPLYPDATLLYAMGGKARQATQMWWLDRMLRTQRPLLEKMTLFWHGHFATSIQKVPAPLMAQQIDLFRSRALGNFRTVLAAVSVDPAMSIWLDNRYNSKAHPNENYAREVMELFALGLGNYTEDDIREAARALTGWPYNGKTMTVAFNAALHDDGLKTILGRTGSFGLADVVDIIAMQPIHQRFMTRKLLEYFVYSDPEPELIEALAQTYALSGYDIAKTVGTLLRSNVFYSTRAYRALPKSPIEFVVGVLRCGGASSIPTNVPDFLRRMGQEPLAPPSVKGWDGGPTWINTNTLLSRFNFVNNFVATSAAKAMTPSTAPNLQPDAIVRQAGGFDPERVIATIVASMLQDDVTSDVRRTLVGYLNSSGDVAMAGSQANAMPFGSENYQEKIRGAIALTLNLPVNQLN
ncbi:MAG: hypothetical protein NVSMB64_26330 [Candidatus Velthaea sp.]